MKKLVDIMFVCCTVLIVLLMLTQVPTETLVPTQVPTETLVPTQVPTETPVPTQVPTETPVPVQCNNKAEHRFVAIASTDVIKYPDLEVGVNLRVEVYVGANFGFPYPTTASDMAFLSCNDVNEFARQLNGTERNKGLIPTLVESFMRDCETVLVKEGPVFYNIEEELTREHPDRTEVVLFAPGCVTVATQTIETDYAGSLERQIYSSKYKLPEFDTTIVEQ